MRRILWFLNYLFPLTLLYVLIGVFLDCFSLVRTEQCFIQSSALIEKEIRTGGSLKDLILSDGIVLKQYENDGGLYSFTLEKEVSFVLLGKKNMSGIYAVYLGDNLFQPF